MSEKRHGGTRAGAGRKSLDRADVVAVVTAYLDQDAYDLVQELGQGNDALGIRLMAAEILAWRAGGHAKRNTVQAAAPAPTLQSTAKPSTRAQPRVDPATRAASAKARNEKGWAEGAQKRSEARRLLNVPTTEEEESPFDRNAVYD